MNNAKPTRMRIRKSRRPLYFILFFLSVVVTFLLTRERSVLVLVAKSLFLFLPFTFIDRTIKGMRETWADYKHERGFLNIVVMALLGLGVCFCLVLIGLCVITFFKIRSV